MQAHGWRCVYHNSGCFAPTGNAPPLYVGWIGPEDPTIRPEMRELAVTIPPPDASVLAELTTCAWRTLFPGEVWLMPASHWAFELHHSPHRIWLEELILRLGLNPSDLTVRTDASAICFQADQSQIFERTCSELLDRLESSDFTVAFPGHPVVGLLHHHRQVWWTTWNLDVQTPLRRLAEDR